MNVRSAVGSAVVSLLPLDDRPVNTAQVAELAEAAGVELRLPPPGVLGRGPEASDLSEVATWLDNSADQSDVLIVNVNQLVHGGFVPSRRTGDPATAATRRLAVLDRVHDRRPGLPLLAYHTVMRTKDVDDAGTEPAYWASYGRRFAALSRELYRAEHGPVSLDADVEGARAAIPAAHVNDFLRRRLTLHTQHLTCLSMLAEGVLDALAIAAEDTTTESVSTSEREWLRTWINRLDVADRAWCYPGADEVAAVLVARAALAHRGLRPTVAVTSPGGLDAVAPYEDQSIGRTVADQATAVGLRVVDDLDAADLVLAVHPPTTPSHDWFRAPTGPGAASPDQDPRRLAELVGGLAGDGRLVAVADTAYANGADPALVAALVDHVRLDALAGYAGWNTAGNTIGSALAQACVRLCAESAAARAVHRRMLARRFLEDWAYQAEVRPLLAARPGGAGDAPAMADALETGLTARLARLPAFAGSFRLVPGSVRLPWDRLFEVDFQLEPRERRRTGDEHG